MVGTHQIKFMALTISVLHSQNFVSATSVCIGAVLMQSGDEHIMYALQHAENIMREQHGSNLKSFFVEMSYVHKSSVFDIRQRVCYLMEKGAIGIVGSSNANINNHISVICNELGIPFFSILTGGFGTRDMSGGDWDIRLFPRLQVLNAVRDMVLFWEWKHVTLVYKDDSRIIDLSTLIEDYKLRSVHLRLLKIDGSKPSDFLEAASRISTFDECASDEFSNDCDDENYRIVLDLHPKDAHQFFLAALKLGQINIRHWFILTSTDMLQMDLEWFRHNQVRITGFDVRHLQASQRVNDLVNIVKEYWWRDHPNTVYFPVTETLLAYDSVVSFTNGLLQLQRDTLIEPNPEILNRCNRLNFNGPLVQASQAAKILYNHIQFGNGVIGATGNLSFELGTRPNMTLNIYQIGFAGKTERIGSWNGANEHSAMDVNETIRKALNVSDKTKPHFVITTIVEPPYIKQKRYRLEYGLVKNKKDYEGFCMDLLMKLSEDLGFSFDLRIVADGKYGAADEDGRWNGMIGEVMSGAADMAVAPLTMNYKRAQAVDFTQPFLSLGISILFRIPTDQKPGLFSFLNPLANSIWVYLAACIVIITVSMFFIARLTPYEWNPVRHSCGGFRRTNRPVCSAHASISDLRDENDHDSGYNKKPAEYHPKHPCYAPSSSIPAPVPPPPIELVNNYSFFNTVWYVGSTLMKGGCDFGPKAMSTRLLGGMWWVFTLVLVSAYTANLAAVLTVDKYYLPIKNMEELANQSAIGYGSIYQGSTMQFFQESKIVHHKRMWERMNSSLHGDNSNGSTILFTQNNKQGVERVLNSNYAYLMESSSLEYEIIQNCNLTQIGGVLGSRGYGIAFKKGSPWTDLFSRHILIYGKKGTLEMLKKRWFEKSSSCNSMKEYRRALNMDNVAGLFLVLLGGMCLAVVSVFVEFCIRSKQNASEDKLPLCKEMAEELCFAIRLTPSKKKHKMSRKCTHCDEPSTAQLQLSPYVPGDRIYQTPSASDIPTLSSPLEQINGKLKKRWPKQDESLQETTT